MYFYFRDNATGLITGVQPVHFEPDARVVIDDRIPTRDLAELPERDAGQARRRGHSDTVGVTERDPGALRRAVALSPARSGRGRLGSQRSDRSGPP